MRIIKDALVKHEKAQAKKEAAAKGGKNAGKDAPLKQRPLEFNKEENEEIMEGLMNRIVARPTFGDDPRTNKKIDALLKVKSFQKMVDQADLLQDVSNSSSFLNQSQFMQKSLQTVNSNSFQKILPNASQMREDEDPDALPCFG